MRLDISRTTGDGYALRLRFDATLDRAVHALPGARRRRCSRSTRARSPSPARSRSSTRRTSSAGVLDLRAWARDALALALPATLLCRPDCAGLCPVCGTDLNARRPRPPPRARAGPALGQAVRAAVRLNPGAHRPGGAFRLMRTTCAQPASRAFPGPASLLARWPFPSRSSPTHAPRSAARSTRSARRRYNACPQCHSPRLPHRVCPVCGSYKGREVLAEPGERAD